MSYWSLDNVDPFGDPPWTCPRCKTVNFGFRKNCRDRACNMSVDEAFPGEGLLVGAFVVDDDGVARNIQGE
jgi:hypothetical protein